MKRLPVFLILLVGATLLLLASCGSDSDPADPTPGPETTTETIGAAGGSIGMDNAVELEIPAGALGQDVEFSLSASDNPPADPTGRDCLGEVYSIGPSGTSFDEPATITLQYDEADLGEIREADIVIYTSSGSGWTALPTTVDAVNNEASASVVHLSMFAATVPGGAPADGVYAQLEVLRLIGLLPGSIVNRVDMATARFDSFVSPCQVVQDLHPTAVSCNGADLVWDPMMDLYVDENGTEFITLGAQYSYSVTASDQVPALTAAIEFPSLEPYITNIDDEQVLSTDGFTVEWANSGTGNVVLGLAVCDPEDPSLVIETANDGSHTFSAADLASMPPGEYVLFLNYYNREFIDAPGYDPQSHILAGNMDFKIVFLGSAEAGIGPDGGTLALGEEGYLDIPESALGQVVEFAATVNSSPAAVPEGWELISSAYTVAPVGTTFSVPATLGFSYDEAELGDGDESSITLFMDSGSGWVALETDVYEFMDSAQAQVAETADFAAMIEVDIAAEGVFAEITIERHIQFYSPDYTSQQDWIFARFDEVYEPGVAVTPLQSGGVAVGAWNLVWNADEQYHQYTIVEAGTLEFLDLEASYDVEVTAGGSVPALSQEVTFPASEPCITSHASLDTVTTGGFTLEWNGTGADRVTINLMESGAEGVPTLVVETDNDGSHTFSAQDLAGLQGPMLGVELICGGDVDVVAEGYDPRSTITVRTYHWMSLWFLDE